MNMTLKLLVGAASLLVLAGCSTPTAVPPTAEPPAAAPTTMAPTAAAAASANAAPAVQVVALQEGTTFVQGQEVGVAVLAGDSDGIKSAGLLIDGNVVATLDGTSGKVFQGTLMWTPDKPGQYKAAVIVYDTAGTVAKMEARNVTVLPAATALPAGAPTVAPVPATATPTGDTAPPAVSITVLKDPVTAGGDTDVAVNAVDSVGVVKMELYVDGNVQDTWNYDTASGPAPQSAFQTLTWRNSTAGNHEVYVTATDAAGNVGQSVTAKVTVQ